jgi:hypothetical protein
MGVFQVQTAQEWCVTPKELMQDGEGLDGVCGGLWGGLSVWHGTREVIVQPGKSPAWAFLGANMAVNGVFQVQTAQEWCVTPKELM